MRDTDLYAQILGIKSPWFVENVQLNVAKGRVDISLGHEPCVLWACPQCGKQLSCRDHAVERVWRHLDTCQLKTFLHARIPRVDCPEHGVAQVSVPWAEPRGRFTLLMERLIIDVLTQCSTVIGACRLLDISWDEAFGVMQRSVKRGLARKRRSKISYLGVDEKAFRKGHSYMTIVSDLVRGTVEHVAEERKTRSLEEYYQGLSADQLGAIKAVAMDMWPAYFKATSKWVPKAQEKIVFDRFHIMQHVNNAVDKVRKRENRELTAQGDMTLKGTKYLWLFAESRLPDKYRPRLELLKTSCLRVAKAWAMKESLRALWSYLSTGWAKRFFRKWYAWARRSKLAPMVKVAQMLKAHLENIVTYCRHRITNATSEGLNSKIMSIKRKACGHRNKENFKTAIYFFCGGLDLYPRSV